MGISDPRPPSENYRLESDFNIHDPLTSKWFHGRAVDLAEDLIGTLLVNHSSEGVAGGLIVETEAYLGADDPACHLSHGRTNRTEPFYNGGGTIYVFKIYRHSNLNVITEHGSHPECILIRAIEPTHSIELMRQRRNKSALSDLTTGPGKLTEALGITKSSHNNTPLESSTVNIYETDLKDYEVQKSSRVGISSAQEWPLRFTMADNEYISQNLNRGVLEEFDVPTYYDNLRPILSQSLPESISDNE